MGKKILQKHLNYVLPATTGAYSGLGDAETAEYFVTNTCRDLSFLNRQNIEQVTRNGDLMSYGYKVTCSGTRFAGDTDPGSESSADGGQSFFYPNLASNADTSTGAPPLSEDTEDELRHVNEGLVSVRFFAPFSSWVLKNGVKKFHFAREEMFKKAMVEKGSRGAYSHSMRPCLQSATEVLTVPVKGTAQTPITGGTWDITQLSWEPDTGGAYLALTGTQGDEETTTAFTTLSIPQSYLHSRSGRMEADTNVDELTQAKFSVLNTILSPDTTDASDEVVTLAKGEHDNPPYDLADRANDLSGMVEVGRLNFNPSTGSIASTFIEVPGGIFKTQVYVGNVLEDGDLNWSMDMQLDLVKYGKL